MASDTYRISAVPLASLLPQLFKLPPRRHYHLYNYKNNKLALAPHNVTRISKVIQI